MNRILSTGLASAMLVGGLVATASPASASCPEVGEKYYKITNKSTVRKSTNLHSEWMYDNLGGTLKYNQSTTAEVNASGTAGVEAEAGAIFAKASASFSVTVGGSWSKSSSWEYEIPAKNKAGKTKVRMTMFHEAKKFKVTKTVIKAPCRVVKVWSKWITAPVKKDSNVWGLEWK